MSTAVLPLVSLALGERWSLDISAFAATSLLVARYGKTSLKEMENSIKRLQQTGAHINGTVLNDVVKSAALYYRAGYGHYEYGQRPARQPHKD